MRDLSYLLEKPATKARAKANFIARADTCGIVGNKPATIFKPCYALDRAPR